VGSGRDDVFAVGGHGTVLHYDGHVWAPVRSNTTKSLTSAWGPSAESTFFVGENGSIHRRH
jgi:hypothetical protein